MYDQIIVKRRRIIPPEMAFFAAPTAAVGGGPFTFLAASAVGGTGDGPTSGAIDTSGAGLLIVGAVSFATSAAPTVSDSKVGNTWNALTEEAFPTHTRITIWYSVPVSVGGSHTATLSGTANFSSIFFAAFGGGIASPFDQEAGGQGVSTTPSTSGITPGFNNELIITLVGIDDTTPATQPTGYAILDASIGTAGAQHFGGGMAYKIQTTLAAEDPDWSSNSTAFTCRIASFKSS